MPTLQETANRNAADRRRMGVTVYSPTQTLARPQGRTANAGTAARILNGRQAQTPNWASSGRAASSGGGSLLPAYSPPDQPGQGRTSLDDILESLSGPTPPPEPEEPGGWRGVLGTVANSVPGRAFFTALDVLDKPRRAVAATVAEGLDWLNLNADSRTDGDASWSDWWNQFNDPTFGFGDIVASTGNKWLDRGIGLIGDLAMDPLNYVTGSGVIAGTGARMRVNTAARAFAAGVPREVAERTGRIGLQALSNVERRAINAATDTGERLLDRGYYFHLPFTSGPGARIPGSGPLEQAIGGATARARNAVNTARPLSTARYWRSERGLEDAMVKLSTGRGDISFGVAAALINYRKGAGIAANRVNGLLSEEWNRLVGQYGQQGLQDMVHEAETVGGTALNRFYDFAADLMEDAGLQRPSYPNYIPHVFTDEAINWMRNTPEGKAFHNELYKEIDFDDLSPHMLQRKLVGGDEPQVYVLNGVRMEIKEGSIRELNEQFAKALPDAGFKLLDDDIAGITARYSKSMMSSVGEAGGLLHLANKSRGLVRYADDDDVLREIVDVAETRKLNVEAHKTIKQKLSAAKELNATLKQQRDEGVVTLHGATATHLRKLVDTMDKVPKKQRDQLQQLLNEAAQLEAKRDALAKTPLEYTENAAKLTAAADAVFAQLDDEYQKAVERLAAIEPAFKIAEQQWLDSRRAGKRVSMTPVQKEYRKGVVDLSQLTIDRDAAATIAQRVRDATLKAKVIERNIDSDTFVARVASDLGIGDVDTTPPIRYVDPESGEVKWLDEGEPIEPQLHGAGELRREGPTGVERAVKRKESDPRTSPRRTPEAIYAEHNKRRAAAIAPHAANFPVLQQLQHRIESQTNVVLSARQDLFNAASTSSRKVKDAQLHVNEMRAAEREMTARIDAVWGNPMEIHRLKKYQAELAEFRGPGGTRERAIRHYADSQRSMADARQRYDDELRKLNSLKQSQDHEAMRILLVDPEAISRMSDETYARFRMASAELATQERQRSQYASTVAGRHEAKLHSDRRRVERQISESDRRLGSFRNADVGGPWRPVSVIQHPDGSLHVQPLWAGTVGGNERAVVEMAEKRDWFNAHFIDPTVNELDTIASDIARAEDRLTELTGAQATKVRGQLDKMVAKHERLTQRLARFRRFSYEKYERRMLRDGFTAQGELLEAYTPAGMAKRRALIAEVEEMVGARNAMVIEREAINTQLGKLGNKLDVFDANVGRARDARNAISEELDELIRLRVESERGGSRVTLYGARMKSIAGSERNAMSEVSDNAYHYKLHWEPVEQVPTEIGRVGVWTPEERTTLSIAYSIQKAWDDLPNDLRTAEFKEQRDRAVRVIREMTSPNHVRGGMTYSQQYLRNIIEQYDDDGLTAALEQLQRDRIPFVKPTQRSKLGRALAKGSGTGDRSPNAVARRALKMFEELTGNYQEQFIARGIIPVNEMRAYHHKAIELQDVMNAYSASPRDGGGASLTLMSQRDQLAADLNRFNEVMFTLRNAYEEGGMSTPSNPLTAFVAHERLDKEAGTIQLELDRTLHALGNPERAAEDKAHEAQRLLAWGKAAQAEQKYDELAALYTPEQLGRDLTEEEVKALRNAKASFNRYRKKAEDIAPTPMASVLSDEVEHISYIVQQYLTDVSMQFSDLKQARSIAWNQGYAIRRARQLDVTIEETVGSIARFGDEIAEMRRLIEVARANGEDTITYTPYYSSTGFSMTPQEILDEIAGGTRDKIPQQREADFRKRAQRQIAEGDDSQRQWTRQVTDNQEPVTLSVNEAMNRVHNHDARMVERQWNLENLRAERAAVRGEGPRWITHFDQVLQDQVRPPYVEVLRGEMRDLEQEIQRRFPPNMTDAERLDLQLRKDRIDLASGPKMTPGEIEALQRKREYYVAHEGRVGSMGDDEARYVASLALQDHGSQFFTDVVSGARPITQTEIDVATELLGNAEEAQLSLYFLHTFNQLVDILKRRQASNAELTGEALEASEMLYRDEAGWLIDQMRELAGESRLMSAMDDQWNKFESMTDRLMGAAAESMQRTGWEETAAELEATAAQAQIRQLGEKAYTAGERVRITDKLGNEIPQTGDRGQRAGFNINNIRNEVVASLVESAVQAKNAAVSDAQRVMRLFGFDNYIQSTRKIGGTTMTGAQATGREAISNKERFSLLGYSVSQQIVNDPAKLHEFVTAMLHGTDFDLSHALRRNAHNLVARLKRINMMRQSLGASLDQSARDVENVDGFLGVLARWKEPSVVEAELGGDVLDRITDFNVNVRPSMEQIYSDRIDELNRDFAAAVEADDVEAFERIGLQIQELNESITPDPASGLGSEDVGSTIASVTPSGTEDQAAQAAAEAMSAPQVLNRDSGVGIEDATGAKVDWIKVDRPITGTHPGVRDVAESNPDVPPGTEYFVPEGWVPPKNTPPNPDAAASQQLVAAAQTDYDNAKAALAAAEAQMGEGGPTSAINPNAPTQARTIADFMLDDDYERAPGERLTRAAAIQRRIELNAERDTLPRRAVDRTAEQQQQYQRIREDLSGLAKRAWKDEPEWQVDVTNQLYELEARGTPPRWDLATGEDANQQTLERLRAEVARTESALAGAKSEADATHLGPGDATAGELADTLPAGPSQDVARRAELQAQLDAAKAAGDENAVRFAEQQLSWIDNPDEAVQPAVVSPVEAQGVADTITPPDALGPPPKGVPQPLDAQFDEIVDEFQQLLGKYGSDYTTIPDEIKQRMAALSASARKLADDRKARIAADASARTKIRQQVPTLAAYLERMRQVPQYTPPSISSDVWAVMRNGPTQRTFDPAIEMKLKPKVRLNTGVNKNEPAVRLIGEVFPGMGSDTRSRVAMMRGNVTPTGEHVLGAATEASLREQLERSPGRILMTARERLITSLNAAKAEKLAAENEARAMIGAAHAQLGPAMAPELGPELPNLTPEELTATAKGELDRIKPEYQAALLEEQRAGIALGQARAQKMAEAKRTAMEEAQAQRTQELDDLKMDLATTRTAIAAIEPKITNHDAVKNQIRSAVGAVTKAGKVKSDNVQDLLDLAATIDMGALDPAEAKVIATLLADANTNEQNLLTNTAEIDALEAKIKEFGKDPAKSTAAGEVMEKVAIDGWGPIATKLLVDRELSAAGKAAGLRANQSVVIAQELKARLERVTRMMQTPEAWKLVDKYTAFFKTYATGRPGFHVRNALSATFMNLVDGVRIRDMYAGMSAWRAFTKNPREFWESADQRTRDAVSAVLASGAGGQFTERGLASTGPAASRAYRAIMNNRFTRFNQRAGTLVEGAARMGMALNSVHRGQSLDAMVDRISKYHFNYRELSSMDVAARRYIPFWTFMSRNLPLQLEQMWLRPQMYLRYQSFVRNFSEAPDPLTPEYWLSQGAFTMNEDAAGTDSPWYLAPDLPHLRVAEPFEAMASGDWGKALLSDVNPLFMAPTEAFAFNKKVYTGAPIEGEYNAPSAAMTPLLPLLSLLGGTEQGASGQTVVDDRYAHVARSLLPPLELLERLTTDEGTRAGRQGETWARTFGAPVLRLTPELRRSTQRGQRAERREQRQTQAQLARL